MESGVTDVGPAPGTVSGPGHAPQAIGVGRRNDDADLAPARRNEWAVRLLLVQSDVAAILAAYFLAAQAGGMASRTAAVELVATLPVWLLALKSRGLYSQENDVVGHSTIDELPHLAAIATMGPWLFLVLSDTIGHVRPIGETVVFWLLLLIFLPAGRMLTRPIFRANRHFAQNSVIVGAGTVGQLLGRKLLTHPQYRINLVGFVDAMPMERRDDLELLTVLGTPGELPALVEEYKLERVMIAFSNDSHEETLELIRLLKDLDVRIDIVPRLFDIIPPRLTSHTIAGIPLITLPRLRLSRSARFVKRSFDVVVALIATIVLAPTFVLIAILIKLDSHGPVFFRQRRMGAGGYDFSIYKFRTMTSDADELKQDIAHLNAHAGGDPRMFKIRADPRVTRFGRLLRRFSLDEFPQLFNVLRGEMSLIGPRPLILEEDQHVESWARKRLTLKPGMTGLWQVSGRNSIPFEEMVKLDYLYVTTWSLSGDCRLLFQTVPLVLKGERDGHW